MRIFMLLALYLAA